MKTKSIDLLLEEFLKISKEALGDNFFGMYIFGSFASGDFNPETSDIDFVVIAKKDLSSQETKQLEQKINNEIFGKFDWAKKLEGSFLPLRVFKNNDIKPDWYPSISTGEVFEKDHKGIEEPIQRFMLRENNIILEGSDPKTFLEPISAKELKEATLNILHNWWEPQLSDSFRLKDREYQAYSVVTMCRMLFTLKKGEIISKPVSAQWVKDTFDKKWSDLVDRALIWKKDDGVDDLELTKDFIRFTIEEAKS